ncbi:MULTISPECIES: enoyl-CoA hydratase/isomerase family protein [unclassified Mesorhizobium]|uniref:enoyl-CoA hydratase/isomerase family protein n=1 Tax=unclassified Mesorhizobium TaxID=325217 RepID=UPI000FDA2517|nr:MULTISPECIES: enoyl-CoA hydratase/isomerase family protein [unclassified Mesorhizobium]TGR17939.1 enoyl-CoA hydratase/isomerase family protein [Mesorhizobium sp. M8A.F.Ca.ET.197.01.1.1]TGR36583.1 enoyl-CoA hydratase/isomerase family protein [bacterium M00.F.Ca.ET.199.01.1.1]TGR40130.1 enoyl-CoA hydratase/isomerase family protein [Mesorhizobium sp. M8A.F.Ca.ET.198.01.1.1]TGV81631.1 enoyl-CoA hydratase/isomerase family protein [Mesorhizobium sp. M00.F.Ca.ET.149.01.1.1]
MSKFSDYSTKYENVQMERQDGLIVVTLHTNGDSLRWSLVAHRELPEAFHDIGGDPENRVMILTGVGDEFSGPQATKGSTLFPSRPSAQLMDTIQWEGRRLLLNLLDIEIPVIGVVNGPAWRHSEIPLMSDIVLASETAAFQDSAHFMSDLVPGDGVHVIYPLLLGTNRGRHFLLTGKILDAREALEFGLVAEVLPADKLRARAEEIAADLITRPNLLLRYTRLLLTQDLKRRLNELLGYGLALESMALMERPLAPS